MLFKFRVIVMPREDLLDPQGRAVAGVIKDLGVRDVRIGKSIEIEIEAKSEEEALKIVQKVSRDVLSNPIIESYSIQKL